MLGSTDRAKTLSTCEWNGRRTECELCGRVRRCTEHCELVTCRDCQVDYLPSSGVL